jgi:chromate reductase
MNILAILGSLRKDSVNRKAALAFREVLPEGVEWSLAELGEIPLYNQDIQDKGFPPSVSLLAEQIRKADALLFVTPEYNYSIPGVLKNAIDWVSRVPNQPFAGKPAAIIGASPGSLGTARAQYHLRQMGVFLDIRFLNRPEAMISAAYQKFDASGKLIDDPTREHLKKVAAALMGSVT